DKYFFVPGFPQMAHPMLSSVIEKFFSQKVEKYRLTLIAKTGENTLVSVMKEIPSDIEFSSLPMLNEKGASVEISLCSTNKLHVEKNFRLFTEYLEKQQIPFDLI
ncbi:MAG: competence/damage-inducible protein A, partial [Sulfurimonas sp.]|nr:competence/damage-inducible protein A [Sulfurimonas sp.]